MRQFCTGIALILIFIVFGAAMLHAQEAGFEKAVQAYLKKDFKSAADYLKEYVALKPDPAAYYLLGYSTYLLSKKASGGKKRLLGMEAVDYFNEAYLLDPDFSPKSLGLKKVKK